MAGLWLLGKFGAECRFDFLQLLVVPDVHLLAEEALDIPRQVVALLLLVIHFTVILTLYDD